MATCKGCGIDIGHRCSSCDLCGWEWDFCSKACYDKVIDKRKQEICSKLNITRELLEAVINEIDFDLGL
jgi:hypothetical protein